MLLAIIKGWSFMEASFHYFQMEVSVDKIQSSFGDVNKD